MGRGRRIKKLEPSKNSANGVWTINETFNYIQKNKWPGRFEGLVVGGGGGSAGGGSAGALLGGGGGGVVLLDGAIPATPNTILQIKVGVGGFTVPGYGWDTFYASNGLNSSIDSIVALGGGRGGSNGGSGGGGGGLGTNGQGFNGGSSGGGGAGSAGNGVNGGNGRPSSITGQLVYYGGGGAGAQEGDPWNYGNPGLGGGLGGQKANSPGGGSGYGFNGLFNALIRSADGIVVMAYIGSSLSYISPTLIYTLDTTSRPGYKIYKFTSGNGYIRFNGTSVPSSTTPSAPRLVLNWGGSCDDTRIRWQEPEWFGNSPITGYKITSSTGLNTVVSSSIREYTIRGEGAYSIRAINAIGEGPVVNGTLTPGGCN